MKSADVFVKKEQFSKCWHKETELRDEGSLDLIRGKGSHRTIHAIGPIIAFIYARRSLIGQRATSTTWYSFEGWKKLIYKI